MPVHHPGVDLYWLPLGAGAHVVRLNGRIYERIESWVQRRPPLDLYHSALEVHIGEGRYTIEMTPVPDHDGTSRGVVVQGPVGSRLLARLRVFRYEVRRWPGGTIPDVGEAVESPQRVTDGEAGARRLLDLVPSVPPLVWGRDEIGAGEMWNSNSIISWLLEAGGLLTDRVSLPFGGRAPGWDAGIALARRSISRQHPVPGANR
jgi:hypothetical protein